MSMLLITHDIGLVAEYADRVVVMYAGQCVEEATVEELYSNPKHPYTKALLAAVPRVGTTQTERLTSIPGTVPEEYHSLKGCRFAGRCPYATKECEAKQEAISVSKEHKVYCHIVAQNEAG